MKKIILIGLGRMGLAHLKSFLNKPISNLKFYLIDSDIKRLKFLSKLIGERENFKLLKEIPKNEKFDFAIISTLPKPRYNLSKKLLENNNVKYLLLEKFIFNKIIEYKKFNQIIKRKRTKVFVNIWSRIFIERLRLASNFKKVFIEILIPQKSILTNLIHFIFIFKSFNHKENLKIDFSRLILKKNNLGYHDGVGLVKITNKLESSMIIKTQKIRDAFQLKILATNFEKKISLRGKKIKIHQSKRSINFPLSSEVTYKLFKGLMNKNNKINLPFYKDVDKISKQILFDLRKSFKKQIFVR